MQPKENLKFPLSPLKNLIYSDFHAKKFFSINFSPLNHPLN